jgi:hypothetical protein
MGGMGLLALMAFTEGDYAAAEFHVRAIASAGAKRVSEFELMPFVVISSADLRLTGIYRRAPLLPYRRHPQRPCLDTTLKDRARVLGMSNAMSFPRQDGFLQLQGGDALSILQELHEISSMLNEPDLGFVNARPLLYHTGYRIATLQMAVHKDGTQAGKIVLLACQMQLWGTCKPYVVQAGIQTRLLSDFVALAGSEPPMQILNRWLRHGGSLTFLLWALYNACIASLHVKHKAWKPTTSMDWPQQLLQHILVRIGATTAKEMEHLLRQYPFVQHWNGQYCAQIFYACQEGKDSNFANIREAEDMFANLGLTIT